MQKAKKKNVQAMDRSGSTNEKATVPSPSSRQMYTLGMILKLCPLPPAKFQQTPRKQPLGKNLYFLNWDV